MNTEIEAKFLAVDPMQIREKLKSCGGTCEQRMRLMRRAIIETPRLKNKNAYLRVRDEGHRITATYKQFDELSVDGAKEIEVVVDSYDDTLALLAACSMVPRSFQESRRETWKLDSCEVVLDEWPWLKAYIEIEGESEVALKACADKLGLLWQNAVFGDVMVAYRAEYTFLDEQQTIGSLQSVKFGDPLPDMLIDGA